MFDVLHKNEKGEVVCPTCHKISAATAWRNNHGYCPTTGCTQYAIIWEADAKTKAKVLPAHL